MNYWKLLGSTAILMIMLCVGIFLYARWDLKRFEESLGEPPPPISQKMESTQNRNEQTTFGTPVTFKTDEELGFVKQQETESQITGIDGEEAALDAGLESFDQLGDESLDARLENFDITDTVDDALADFLQEQPPNFWGKDSSFITLDATQISDLKEGNIWIEGNIMEIDLEDIKGRGEGGYVIIDKTGVIQRTE